MQNFIEILKWRGGYNIKELAGKNERKIKVPPHVIRVQRVYGQKLNLRKVLPKLPLTYNTTKTNVFTLILHTKYCFYIYCCRTLGTPIVNRRTCPLVSAETADTHDGHMTNTRRTHDGHLPGRYLGHVHFPDRCPLVLISSVCRVLVVFRRT